MLRFGRTPLNLSKLPYPKDVDREHQNLLDRIMAFDIDGGPRQLSFAARLARENDWTVPFAERVIGEYKRFAFLTMTAGHPCTPSDQVDQAWHLHLTYTKSYWDRFCGEVLPRPLHHNPTEGGRAEDAKFDDWYARTLESYEQTFGSPPPSDIWPAASIRFGEDVHFTRVNTRRNWILPKRAVGMGGLALGVILAIGGCSAREVVLVTSLFLGFCLILGVVGILIVGLNRRFGSNGGNGGAGCGGSSGTDSGGGGWFSNLFPGGDGADSGGCGGGGCGGGCGGD